MVVQARRMTEAGQEVDVMVLMLATGQDAQSLSVSTLHEITYLSEACPSRQVVHALHPYRLYELVPCPSMTRQVAWSCLITWTKRYFHDWCLGPPIVSYINSLSLFCVS